MITHKDNKLDIDPMAEKNAYVMKGVIKKYDNRVLVELTLRCAKYCSFCYRKWKVNRNALVLTKQDINNIVIYLAKNKKINEVIISGGDPMTEPAMLVFFLKKLDKLKNIKVIRIHTRVPIVKPEIMSKEIYLQIRKQKTPIYLSLHINKLNELSEKSIKTINRLRDAGAILYSQSVFLKDINDEVKILVDLFSKLLSLGVRPYNIYHCNKAEGLEKFIVDVKTERKIMTEVRAKISGLACPTLIIDAPKSAHKLPVPLLNFECDLNTFQDFNGEKHCLPEIELT